MSDAERIWRAKSDEALLDAAAELDQYTAEGQGTIRAELKRRGLEDPIEQARAAGGGGPGDESADGAASDEGESLPGPECLRCRVELKFMGTRNFHEGTHWGALGEIGHLFEQTARFDVYMCPECGHIDLFADGVGEETRPE